jgi:hypothetical protein
MSTDPVQGFLALRGHLRIVHHVPGRVRLRLGSGLLEAADAVARSSLAGWLETVDGIRGLRLNLAAASVIIEYDPQRLPPEAWKTLVNGSDEAALALLQTLVPAAGGLPGLQHT